MRDLAFGVLMGIMCAAIGFAVALLIWPPVELTFIDDEMTKVMVCRMSTSRGVVKADCADLQALIDTVRESRTEDSSL